MLGFLKSLAFRVVQPLRFVVVLGLGLRFGLV